MPDSCANGDPFVTRKQPKVKKVVLSREPPGPRNGTWGAPGPFCTVCCLGTAARFTDVDSDGGEMLATPDRATERGRRTTRTRTCTRSRVCVASKLRASSMACPQRRPANTNAATGVSAAGPAPDLQATNATAVSVGASSSQPQSSATSHDQPSDRPGPRGSADAVRGARDGRRLGGAVEQLPSHALVAFVAATAPRAEHQPAGAALARPAERVKAARARR